MSRRQIVDCLGISNCLLHFLLNVFIPLWDLNLIIAPHMRFCDPRLIIPTAMKYILKYVHTYCVHSIHITLKCYTLGSVT